MIINKNEYIKNEIHKNEVNKTEVNKNELIKTEVNKNELIKLNRLLITGNLNEYTPLCVLLEIADAHGIKYEIDDIKNNKFPIWIISSIINTDFNAINLSLNDLSLNDLTKIGRFVNNRCNWTKRKLIIAFNFLMDFINIDDPLKRIEKEYIIGSQTPENPNSINACILYKICKFHKINLNVNTTINQMAYGIKLLRENPASVIRRAKIFLDKEAKKTHIINFLLNANTEIQDPEFLAKEKTVNYNIIPQHDITHEYLNVLHQNLSDIRTLQQKIDPITDSGAIALSAIIYNIDISKSKNPIFEYKILRTVDKNQFIPNDNWLKYWYNKNEKMFDLTKTFNPLFSKKFYDKNMLLELVTNEGFTDVEIRNDDHYELLQLSYLSENFYLGEFPNIETDTTPIDLDKISDIPYGELLCYGQINSKLRPVSINELNSLFTANQNFASPFDANKIFTKQAINKLKMIAMSSYGQNNQPLTEETINNRANLGTIINNIEYYLNIADNPTKILAQFYLTSSLNNKQIVKNILTKLLHLGMYMRGWSGIGDFPLNKTVVPTNKELDVSLKVTQAIADYENLVNSSGDTGVNINNLPLVLYKDNNYTLSKDKLDGLTIIDRISIVKLGDKTANMSSCIRLTSNWICSSAHKYLCAIGIISFNIKNLRYIS
jgi:hypothetical protein